LLAFIERDRERERESTRWLKEVASEWWRERESEKEIGVSSNMGKVKGKWRGREK
jgi:hypothetical protein